MHTFTTLSLISMLAEARKDKLGLFLTHQYLEQIPKSIRNAVFGNVGTLISFRVRAEDARYLAKEFYPVFDGNDFINLPKYSIYLKLMIDGMTSKPFSAISFALKEKGTTVKEEIIKLSRKKYGRGKSTIKQAPFPIPSDKGTGQATLFP